MVVSGLRKRSPRGLSANIRAEKFRKRKIRQLRRFFEGSNHSSIASISTETSVFFITKKMLLYFSTRQFTKYYLHIGHKKNHTHQGFRPALRGFYNNLSLINISFMVYYYRRTFKFLLALVLRNYRLCLISHQIEQYFNKAYLIFGYHLIFDYWIPGTVSNYTVLSKQPKRKAGGFIKRFPQILVTVRLDPPKVLDITKEANFAGIPHFSFLDTDISMEFFSYFLPANTKMLISFRYCLFLLTLTIRRAMLIKKMRFFKKVL